MKLRKKLLLILLFVALLPTITVALFSIYISKSALEDQVYAQLITVRNIKKNQIESFFDERQLDLKMLANSTAKLLNFESKYSLEFTANELDPYFNNFIEKYGYYDLFIINPKGDIFYSAFKESDYQTNLISGQYNQSNLAALFKSVQTTKSFQISDFSPYAPSNNEPAGFIATPLETPQGTLVIALQLSIEKINELMQYRAGMGETGETYLIGSDYRMRSDSFLDPENHSVNASFFGNVAENGVDTEAAKLAISGETGNQIVMDYNGNLVLSAFVPLNIKGLNWALLAEIDEAEAFDSLNGLYIKIGIYLIVMVAMIIAIALYVSNSILKPLGGEPDEMYAISESIADGDLSVAFEERDNNESVYSAMKKMSWNLKEIITDIIHNSGSLSDVANKTSSLSLHSSNKLEEQKASLETVSAAVEEMSASINEVAESATQTAHSAKVAQTTSISATHKLTETVADLEYLDTQMLHTSTVMESLEKGTYEIGIILEVIRGIADQTNLLALNAAIEAARAGEQGRGFAVVADDIRSLALKTQQSTKKINVTIESLQNSSKETVLEMESSRDTCKKTLENANHTSTLITAMNSEVENISDMTVLIAAAVEQQSSVSKDISKSITLIYDSATENLESVQSVSLTSQKINDIASSLKELTLRFKVDG